METREIINSNDPITTHDLNIIQGELKDIKKLLKELMEVLKKRKETHD